MAVTVLIADDNQRFRQAVGQHLNEDPQIRLVGEACHGEETVQLATELKPDLVLLDISMLRLNGLDALKQIKAAQPETKVIILTIHDEECYRRAAADHGADGFILKKEFSAALIPTIQRIMCKEPERGLP